MKRSRLLGASAGMVLLAGIGCGTAQAAPPGSEIQTEDLPPQDQAQVQDQPPSAPVETRTEDAAADPQPEAEPTPVPEAEAAPAPAPESDNPPPPQQAAADPAEPAAAIAPAKPGVLTRQGALVVEPSIQYQHSNINTFVAGGVAILDTVLIGNVQASQANRDAVTATLGLRYGVTDRIEAELRVPGMYRHDSTTNTVVSPNTTQEATELHTYDLGDIEGAVHYQLNDGGGDWPIFVANVRVKSDTGKGPFDVKRDALGVPQELATGSGYWGVEPSLTLIAPSDPAVFFVNAGYLYNFSTTVDKVYDPNRNIHTVDPGGAVRLGFGMGVALNEKVSFSLGYQHDFIAGTKTTFSDNTSFHSQGLSVGTVNLGANWQINDHTALNVTVGIGATRDAPDVSLMARLPITFDLF